MIGLAIALIVSYMCVNVGYIYNKYVFAIFMGFNTIFIILLMIYISSSGGIYS